MNNFIDLNDFSVQQIDNMVKHAIELKTQNKTINKLALNKIMGGLFFEPSTRTQFSFQTAMFKLGGNFLSLNDTTKSSIAKGESFSDTIKIMSIYSNVLTIRHNNDGAARAASLFASCPVINAGDGIHLHPTQTLTDLVTLKQNKGVLDGLKIGFCGDLKFSRPINSLVRFLCKRKNNKFIFISTTALQISNFLRTEILKSKNSFEECSSLESVISQLDVLYMTRIQKERFNNAVLFKQQKKQMFKLTKQTLNLAKSNLIIMHPLPRVNEIDFNVDDDERAFYFEQAKNGIFARMALILEMLNGSNLNENHFKNAQILTKSCSNQNCISNKEFNLKKLFIKTGSQFKCAYCDEFLS